MNFQENKFPIVLGAVTAVAAGGLIFWGLKGGGRYNEAESSFQSAESEMRNLTREPIKPTDDNRRSKRSALRDYAGDVARLHERFDPYRRPEPPNVEPSAFVDSLLAASERLEDRFDEHGVTVPDPFFLGMGRYTTQQPSRGNTGLLNFALGGFEELFAKLAAAAPSELLNASWAGLPGEGNGIFRRHGIEITFRGSEESLREFLGSLDDSEDHFYQVRVMRVKNVRDTAPNAGDARFVQETAEVEENDDIFGGGFDFGEIEDDAEEEPDGEEDAEDEEGGEAEAPAAEPADSGEILKQVLGSEEIQVFLKIDVLQFLAPREIPEV